MSSPTSPKRRALLLFVLGTLTAFGPLSIDMYLPSMPSIQEDLGTSASLVQLTLAAFMAGLGIGQFVYGPLSDRFGRRRPLLVGIVLYILASAVCAFAPNVHWLIALRFLQALGGASGAVISRAIVRDLYSGREIARVLSLLMLIMGAAPILAPLLGSQVLGFAGWRAIFGVLTVLGGVALVLALVAIPRVPAHARPSAAASLGTNLRVLFTDRRFLTATLAGGFAQSGLFAYISGAPFVLMEVLHVTPERFAGLFATNAMGFICASQLNRRLLARRSPERIAVSGSLFMLLMGAALLVLAVSGLGRVYTLAPALFLFIASIGFVTPNAAALALEEHGPRAGVASAVLGSLQFAVSAAASAAVGLFNDGGMLPMAAVMAVCAGGACLMALGVPAKKQDEAQDAAAAAA
ncbi:DHA1 family bicyclomycin/chloramphenicol resistance-like MFS transporter [Archangium gephyra]|uniref:DHA1 family bicyclomycin/chloramphenicol resistance-like MFS transporter n=1 Tax=Archangium gephyra TaxID=48 RepID=A0AAC8Q035_9BACT|nr:multidrug effflux MFS transporter [Archangium gephyra]AKI98509.1 Multidrug resistance transporter, Bcr/CflA family [Archangium gephyra]REG20393.1 DHA1 family bicyclomycin/chloramphenicol resistance-like MFS transporter [Archangium gephyra]